MCVYKATSDDIPIENSERENGHPDFGRFSTQNFGKRRNWIQVVLQAYALQTNPPLPDISYSLSVFILWQKIRTDFNILSTETHFVHFRWVFRPYWKVIFSQSLSNMSTVCHVGRTPSAIKNCTKDREE